MNVNEVALFSACLCSTDILISMNVTRYKLYPTLYSIVLGAGLWNDSITVVMDQVFSAYLCPNVGIFDKKGYCSNPPHADLSWKKAYEIPGTFLYVTLKGILVGMLFGIITGLVTKYYRSLTRSPIQETFFMMMMAIQSYYVGEVVYASGVTSIIVCAVM